MLPLYPCITDWYVWVLLSGLRCPSSVPVLVLVLVPFVPLAVSFCTAQLIDGLSTASETSGAERSPDPKDMPSGRCWCDYYRLFDEEY